MSDLDVLAELRTSGLRDRGPTGQPVYRGWQRFQHRQDAGALVVDATQFDTRSESGIFLLRSNPFALVESLLVAGAVFEVQKCVVLMASALQDFEAVILNSLEAVQRSGLFGVPDLELEFVRDAGPSIFVNGFTTRAGETVSPSFGDLVPPGFDLFYRGHALPNLGTGELAGSYLLTMGGGVKNAGLVETPLGGHLRTWSTYLRVDWPRVCQCLFYRSITDWGDFCRCRWGKLV